MNDKLNKILQAIELLKEYHTPNGLIYNSLKVVARDIVLDYFGDDSLESKELWDICNVILPFFSMGKINSTNLFDIDELIIFLFYKSKRGIYNNVLDIGANIGLHSIVMEKNGFNVKAFEPDPIHFERLKYNLSINNCTITLPYEMAVSDRDDIMEFTRVVDNTTGSHISGSKDNPYGPLETFEVQVVDVMNILDGINFIKVDAEGQEKYIIPRIPIERWATLDAMIEVENIVNGKVILDYFEGTNINLFSQKNNWQKVISLDDMPDGHKDGSLFITSKNSVW